MGAFASAYSIGLIAIDRYLYILYGLHYHRYFTTRHSYCVVSLIWFMGLVIGFAGTFIWRFPMKGHACWYTLLVPTKVGLFMIFVEIIPMVLIVVVYGIILKNAINAISRTNNCPSVSHLHPETNSRNQQRCKDGEIQIISCSVNDQLPSSKRLSLFGLPCCRRSSINLAISRPKFCKNKWKAVKIVVFTAGAYVVTWFPTFVAWVLYANCDLETDFEYCEKLANLLTNPLSFMILSNSLIDPVIYAWWHPGFRKSTKKMYSMFLRTKESSRTGSRTSEPKTLSLNRKGEF
ncbi:5-hydroxytryptamine receptor 1A-like [Eupeodes corollae]|uniref:5-hydroxytryptamine receptor 1A-like n=1 Tax=Eupeodes corollae TaxID=290404 RepID=UPI002490EB92|nr:5-hydroxytryptamine receptor 1A-like [Eupeodes corollae]